MHEKENDRRHRQVLSQHFRGEKLGKAAVRMACLDNVILPLLHSIVLCLTLYSVPSNNNYNDHNQASKCVALNSLTTNRQEVFFT